MTTPIIIGVAGIVIFAIILTLARSWVGTAKRGGQDSEARKRLEEMARREKKADRIKAGPVPIRLRVQLDRLRARLDRHRD